MTNEILNVRDLQKYLKIGRDKAYSLMKTKGFPSIKIGGQYSCFVAAIDAEKCIFRARVKDMVDRS